jgi:tRNA pseudouridine38-40 synthase
MTNFRLKVEYDGTDFHGWQIQPGVRTVQRELQEALSGLLGIGIQVNGCCRTDAGVHARGLVGNFFADTRMEPDQIRRALAGGLPRDIVVHECEAVDDRFHARYSCVARSYQYKITTAPAAVLRRVLAYTKYGLDCDRMSEGARLLVGEHDFTSFAPASLDEDVSPVCHVLEALLRRDGAVISFDVTADRFLHHMVRNIVGTLIEVGRGRLKPERVGDILRKKDRREAGPTAPACGLVLVEAHYPPR